MTEKSASVPCNGCRACCEHEAVILHPDKGDDVATYDTMPVPGAAIPGVMLKHKPDGSCTYLGESGCTIYERRPYLCRLYDCRKFFISMTNREKRRLLEMNPLYQKEFDAAKARLDSLTHEDKQKYIAKRKARVGL